MSVTEEDLEYLDSLSYEDKVFICQNNIRPCPFVACRYHFLLTINLKTGSIKDYGRNLEDLQETCSLDVVQEDENLSLNTIASLMGVTVERVRQIEKDALRKYRELAMASGLDKYI